MNMQKFYFLFTAILFLSATPALSRPIAPVFEIRTEGPLQIEVIYGGTTYSLTSQYTSYFETPSLLESQPWWEDSRLAAALAGSVQYDLGDLFGGTGEDEGIPGALFAYGISSGGAEGPEVRIAEGDYVSIAYWNGSDVTVCASGCPTIDDFYFYAILNELFTTPSEGFAELYTAVPMVAFNMVESFQGAASGRMLHLRQSSHDAFAKADPLDGLMLASAGDVTDIGPITGDGEKNKNFWGKLYGVTGDVDGDDAVAGYDYSIGGFVLGADLKVCEKAYLGLLAGISSGRADTDLSDDFDVKSYQVGLYSSYENGPYYLDGIVTYAQSDYETSRATAMGTAEGDYDGYEWGASVEFGYVMDKDNIIFEPYLGTQYILVDQDSFDEQGAGSMNMSIDSRDAYSWKAIAGGRISSVYEQKNGTVFVPELKFAFKHEFGDDRDVVTANFVTTPAASSFVFKGLEHKRESIELGVAARVLQANNVEMDVDLVTEFNGDQQAYAASVGLKYTW